MNEMDKELCNKNNKRKFVKIKHIKQQRLMGK